MMDRVLLPDFSAQAMAELDEIHETVTGGEESTRISGIFSGAPMITMIR